jgi:hypothetical protein
MPRRAETDMRNETVWAPGIVHSLLRDPEMAAVLRNPLPTPRHDHGSEVSGCAAFPADWTDEIITARAWETIAGNSWRSMSDTYAYYREYDGVWLYVVVRGQPDDHRRTVATFPFRYGEGVTHTPRDDDFIAASVAAMVKALEAEPGDWIPTFASVGAALYGAGEVAEALMWLIESVDSFRLDLPEDIYLNLYLMAVTGVFSSTRATHPEEIIAAAWVRAYPVTWGLPPRMQSQDLDVDVPADSVPTPSQVAERAKRWLNRILPSAGMTEQRRSDMLDSVFDVDTASIRASFSEHAATILRRRARPQHDDAETETFDYWELVLSEDPRDKLAGFALLLATAELADCEADFVAAPNAIDSEECAIVLLRQYLDYDALQRMVRVSRAP